MVRKNAMKRARRLAHLTQSEVAKQLRLSQSTYQRWESGELEVPEKKVIPLAQALGVTVEYLRGQPEPFDLEGMDERLPADRKNYGYAAIHFCTGCHPLLLPISDGEYGRILTQLDDEDTPGLVIQSLDNRTVYIRRAAIGDMYLTGDEVGECEPEEYGDQYLGIAPDDAFWRIVSQLDSCQDLLAEAEFTEEDVVAVLSHIQQASPASGDTSSRVEFEGLSSVELKSLDLDAAVASLDQMVLERYMDRANCVVWDMPGVGQHDVEMADNCSLYNAFDVIFALPVDEPFVSLNVERFYKLVAINLSVVNYVSVPTQRYNDGCADANAEYDGETAQKLLLPATI